MSTRNMTDQDVIDMAQRSIEEIEMLRRQNSEMAPKAEAYALILKIIGLIPDRSHSAGEDIVWRLKHQIAELREKKSGE
jgi:hypothetical protein